LDPATAKQLSVTKARESLTQPVIWDKLLADIQKLMRSHMSYDEALAAARADAEIHSHLDARHLVSMLVRIIYRKSLDRTPWIKYIPCLCYKGAEYKLTKALISGEVPTRWPNLRKDIQDDAAEILAALYDSVTEEEDDEGRDAIVSPGEESQNKPQRRTSFPRQAKLVGTSLWTPHPRTNPSVHHLHPRNVLNELIDTKPWDVMFEVRSKFLILHVLENLSVVAHKSLDAIVTFMAVHRRVIWWFGHWVFINLETDDLYSVELHRERMAECDKAKNEYKKLLNDRVDAGLEETILDEPGSWPIPVKCCHWILIHESHVKDDGTRYTLNEQMEHLGDQEPAQVQWNTCASDEDRIKHLAEDYLLKLLKSSQRQSQANRITLDFD
ncbi:hypothetical protein PHMEG_00028274, partial [Phytophthora megakarya]